MAAKKNVKEQNGEGNVRQLKDGSYECLIQSKYLNPKTGKPKRIKRKAATERKQEKKPKWIWQHGKKIMNVEVTPK